MTATATGTIALYVRDMHRRGLAESTVANRRRSLFQFARWLRRKDITNATRADIQAWLDSCRIGDASRDRYLTALHDFYLFCQRERLLRRRTVPTTTIPRPRLAKGLPRPIPDREFARALASADRRMTAWLALERYAGLRSIELSNLRREDVYDQADPPYIRVRGKGGRERVVPLHDAALAALRAWRLPSHGWVFPGRNGGRMTAHSVSQAINLHLHACGCVSTAHQSRHAFATQVLDDTGNLRVVQELLGHASPETTAIYTKVAASSLASAVRNMRIVTEVGSDGYGSRDGSGSGSDGEIRGAGSDLPGGGVGEGEDPPRACGADHR